MNPTRSTKRTVTIFRSSASAGAAGDSGAPQALQKLASAGFSRPQLGQSCMVEAYGAPAGDAGAYLLAGVRPLR